MAKKWKYLKGGESDFIGSHAVATHCARHIEKGHSVFTDRPAIINLDLFEFSAQRQLVDDGEEQDLNECIGSTEALIAERGARYGKFKDGAEIMQELKHVMHEVDGWSDLSPSQKEALDMIQHKVGRILNGDPNYDDNCKDVAGYATLIVNELNGEVK